MLPWMGLTSKGRWTILKLKLDSPGFAKRRKRRQSLEGAIRTLGVFWLSYKWHSVMQSNKMQPVKWLFFFVDVLPLDLILCEHGRIASNLRLSLFPYVMTIGRRFALNMEGKDIYNP